MIMATGAVEPTEENLKKWFEAGVVCVGMGSKLFPKESIQEKNGMRSADSAQTRSRSSLPISQNK